MFWFWKMMNSILNMLSVPNEEVHRQLDRCISEVQEEGQSWKQLLRAQETPVAGNTEMATATGELSVFQGRQRSGGRERTQW